MEATLQLAITLIASLVTLVTALTVLVKQLQSGKLLAEIHINTNGALADLKAEVAQLRDEKLLHLVKNVPAPPPDPVP